MLHPRMRQAIDRPKFDRYGSGAFAQTCIDLHDVGRNFQLPLCVWKVLV
jgi:hypothetical protein